MKFPTFALVAAGLLGLAGCEPPTTSKPKPPPNPPSAV